MEILATQHQGLLYTVIYNVTQCFGSWKFTLTLKVYNFLFSVIIIIKKIEWIQMKAVKYFVVEVKIENLVLWLNNWLEFRQCLTRDGSVQLTFFNFYTNF